MKPIIGVIPLWDDERASIWMLPGYMDLIRESGGIPVILPMEGTREDILQVCQICSGFLMTGGHDVDPRLYGQTRGERCGVACEARDRLERVVYDYAVDGDLPLLGICRGIQLMNVFGGGTLYQDLPTEFADGRGLDDERGLDNGGAVSVNHQMSAPYDRAWHCVCVVDGTFLSQISEGSQMWVNSYHHQAIRDLSPQFEAMAFAEDGLIEAIKMRDRRFIVGVQWHPEFNYKREASSRELARVFIEMCCSR